MTAPSKEIHMDNEIISVIVPVYNAETTIKRCIESVLGQTYEKIELLLIDDGSVDESFEICKRFAEKDSRIRVFHKKNEGPSKARNLGIRNANGRYVAFVDADDYIETDMYKTLLSAVIDNNVQMSVCKWKNVYKDYEYIPDIEIKGNISACELEEIIISDDIKGGGGYTFNRLLDYGYVRNKYNREVLFKENISYYEDKILVLEFLNLIKNVSVVDYCGYNYIYSKNSISHRNSSVIIEDYIKAWKYMEQIYGELPVSAERKKMEGLFGNIWGIYKEGKKQQAGEIWKLYRKRIKKILAYKDLKRNIKYMMLDTCLSSI